MLVLKFCQGIRKERVPSGNTSGFILKPFGCYTVLLGGGAVVCWV